MKADKEQFTQLRSLERHLSQSQKVKKLLLPGNT
jgi:hypothetical protein